MGLVLRWDTEGSDKGQTARPRSLPQAPPDRHRPCSITPLGGHHADAFACQPAGTWGTKMLIWMPAASGEMCVELTTSLGSRWGCITAPPSLSPTTTATANTKPQHRPVFPLNPSHIRASRKSHRNHWHHGEHITSSQQRNPALIFTLNLVLLSGLCLNTPSEVSHFRETRGEAGATMLYKRSHHRLPGWYSLTSQKAAGFKTKSGFQILRQTEPLGRRFR